MSMHASGSQKRVRFASGWHRNLEWIAFLPRVLGYLIHPKRFPLFFLQGSRKGILETYRIEAKLGIRKSVHFNGTTFFSLNLPHYPSPAFDYAVAHGALNLGGGGSPAKQHVDSVFLGITRRCEYSCKHCYERRNINGREVIPVERWVEVVRSLQEIGVSIVILSGGEPMLRYDDILTILRSGDKQRSDFHIHTSGAGLTLGRARELKQAGLTAAAVGLDDVDPKRLDALRGRPGAFSEAVRSLGYFNQAGVLTYTNICLTAPLVRSGGLWEYYELVRDLNVGFVQILEPRPTGGYAGRDPDDLFSMSDRKAVQDFVRTGNGSRKYRNYPPLVYVADIESPENLGCIMGGLSHFSIDSTGNVIPCVFVPIGFGNILQEDIPTIFRRMRAAIPMPIRKGCASLLLKDVVAAGAETIQYTAVREKWGAALFDAEPAAAEKR
jgi:MoaA/NifB/PqqE/SkfB family radical SAM enzyme